MKKQKTVKVIKNEPVCYKNSILAAFDRQNKGKICPLCDKKLSLAAYREHLDSCEIDKNDKDVLVIASYSKEEAILLRAGPEIVLNDEVLNEQIPNPEKSPSSLTETVKASVKKRKSVSDGAENNPESAKLIKTSPKTPRRRSTRIQMKSSNEPAGSSDAENLRVKVEEPKVADILDSIKKFEEENQIAKTNDKVNNELPYYVNFTIRIIKKVLSTSKFDGTKYDDTFWTPDDLKLIQRFVEVLSIDSKCLFLRIFLRKPGWYAIEKLDQKYPEVSCMKTATNELIRWKLIEDDSSLRSLTEALKIADLSALKNVGRKIQIDVNRPRPELIKTIKNFVVSQKSMFVTSTSVEMTVLRQLKKELGCCVRMKNDAIDLFKAIFTIYCPTTTNSALLIENSRINVYQEMLYLMLQLENGSIKFPSPLPCPFITSFFKNRQQLFSYVESKNMEQKMLENMSQTPPNYDAAFDIALTAKDIIDDMLEAEKDETNQMEIFERKFSRLWVLARCCGHGAAIMEKKKNYSLAAEWQTFLIKNEALSKVCIDLRGIWWDRLLLNLDSHLKLKNECGRLILEAFEDKSIMDKEMLMIQDRAERIFKNEYVPKISLHEPNKVTISGRIIGKDLGDGRINRFVYKNAENDDVECSVEEIVRMRYLEKEGFLKGIHDEGAGWHTLFGLIFYDVIFEIDQNSNKWLSELQDCPIDLSNSLFNQRKEQFEQTFEWLEKCEEEEICEKMEKIWNQKNQETNRECSWRIFKNGVQDCKEIVKCTKRSALISIFRRLAENYRNCRSGFPDLMMWNTETRQIAVVEVKGPGDRLSTKQRLWLDHFQKSGIRAEVCFVTAEKEKKL